MASLKEGFGFREKWIKMLFKILPAFPDLFVPKNLNDAQFRLGGIGGRQVPAVQEWGEGIGLIEKDDHGMFHFTDFGDLIRLQDPTLAEYGTAWAIHYSICANNSDMLDKLWFYFHYSNTITVGKFSRSDVEQIFLSKVKSLSVLKTKIMAPLCETMRQSPLGEELGIGIFPDSSSDFERRAPQEENLHPAVLAYMLCDWANRNSRLSVNIAEFFEYGSVANCLAIDNGLFEKLLQKINDRYNKKILWVSFTAGLNSVSFEKNLNPLDILKTYYLEFVHGFDPIDALKQASSPQ